MKALKTLWGLLVDDVRLVAILGASLVVAFVLHVVNLPLLAAVAIWFGVILALWFSVEYQLKLRKTRDQER